MKIGDEVYIHGYVDEIRNDTIIIRNDGGYFGTAKQEVIPTVRKSRTVEQSSVVGTWIKDDNETYICSACGSGYIDQPTCMGKPMFDYCPICGADMRGNEK